MKYKRVLSFEELEELYSHYELFQAVFPENIAFDRQYKSPLRTDDSSGCKFILTGDILLFIDYSKGVYYNYITFGKQYLNYSSFQLREFLSNKLSVTKVSSVQNIKPKRTLESIKVKTKSFTKEELLDYTFIGYVPTNELLNKAGIYSIDYVMYNEEVVYDNCNRVYAYLNCTFEGIFNYQLYFPKKDKNKRYRCTNNFLIAQLQYLDHKADYVIITKSNMDAFILKHVLGFNAIGILNEGQIIKKEYMDILFKKYKTIVLLLDNDAAGRYATIKYIKTYPYIKFKTLFVPFKYGKDMKDVCKKYDVSIVRKIIKNRIKWQENLK